MAIGQEQVAGADFESEDPHGFAVVHDVGVGVRDGGGAGEHGKLHAGDGGNIANRSIGDHALALQGLENGGMHFSDHGAEAGFRVEVLDDGNARRGKALDADPPIGAIRVGVSHHRRVGGTDSGGGVIAQQARKTARDTLQTGSGIALIAKPDTEFFDGVGDDAGVELQDGFQDLRWQRVVVVPSQMVPQLRAYGRGTGGENTRLRVFSPKPARYYRAQAYLLDDRRAEARAELDRVMAMHGDYAAKAQALEKKF